jgi:hypothetical protein
MILLDSLAVSVQIPSWWCIGLYYPSLHLDSINELLKLEIAKSSFLPLVFSLKFTYRLWYLILKNNLIFGNKPFNIWSMASLSRRLILKLKTSWYAFETSTRIRSLQSNILSSRYCQNIKKYPKQLSLSIFKI